MRPLHVFRFALVGASVACAAAPVDARAPVAAPAAIAEAPAPAVAPLRPKTIGMRTVIEAPLLVAADGTSSLPGMKDALRVSDHYSACFVTRAAEVACWGVTSGGGVWNGVAKPDAPPGLRHVVDVAINQRHACAVTEDGTVSCWSSEKAPAAQDLPRPARELAYSIAGRACALLNDGSIVSTPDWTTAPWDRVKVHAAPLSGVHHLLVCDRNVVCGERSDGGASCAPTWDLPDPRRGVVAAQKAVVDALSQAAPPQAAHVAMDDYATAYCTYTADEVRCFDGATARAQTVAGLHGVDEVALGAARLAGVDVASAACARGAGDVVRCWNLADAEPKLVDPRAPFVAPAAAAPPPSATPTAPHVRVRVEAVTVTGRLPKEVIQRVVRVKAAGTLRGCYERALATHPAASGRVTVKFTIDGEGRVASPAAIRVPGDAAPMLDDGAAVGCIVEAFKKLEFPAPEGGTAGVVFPITFATGDGAP
jgi:hypothetical protein